MSRQLYLIPILVLASIIALQLSVNSAFNSSNLLALKQTFSAAYAQGSANKIDKSIESFGDPINISNNPRDSVYSQVATYKNNTYVVWEEETASDTTTITDNGESSSQGSANYDIFFKKSTDGGLTFSKPINISDNTGFSEHPQIAVSGNNVYLVWTDDTSRNKQILFRMSTDEGTSFGKTIILSDDLGESYNQEISAYGNNVYIVWENKNGYANHVRDTSSTDIIGINNSIGSESHAGDIDSIRDFDRILFKASTDGGNSFKSEKIITTRIGEVVQMYPKIAASGNNVYIVWSGNSDNLIPNDLFFTKSTDNGNKFTTESSLSKKNSLNAEIAVNGNNVYIIWQDFLRPNNQEILFKKSTDGGETFTDTSTNISNNKGTSECPSISISGNVIYALWEDDTPGNHEIYFARSNNDILLH